MHMDSKCKGKWGRMEQGCMDSKCKGKWGWIVSKRSISHESKHAKSLPGRSKSSDAHLFKKLVEAVEQCIIVL